MRALLVGVEGLLKQGAKLLDGQISTLRGRTLMTSDQATIGWPSIPGVKYTGLLNELSLLDHGPDFDDATGSEIVDEPTEVAPGAKYTVLVPKVDKDGNEIGGVRSVKRQAQLGT